MSGITIIGVSKSFGSSRVLDELDIDVPDGALVSVLGTSGSGKTTLLRLIAGLERPDGGTIMIGEEAVDTQRRFVPPERRDIGYVPQDGALFPHLTVAKNISFGLRRRSRGGRQQRVGELLDLVGMNGLAGRYPHELSGGERQRVALARALAPRPQVVLLDEPFSALDAGLRASLRAEVLDILGSAGITTVLVTHDQEEALSSADLVGVITEGRIRQLARPGDLYASPVDAEIAQFLGEANLVEGIARRGHVSTRFGELDLAGDAIGLEGSVLALIRPEQLSLVRVEEASGRAGSRGVSGRVARREYYGHDTVILVEVAGSPEAVRVRMSGCPAVETGEEVVLAAAGETVAWRC